ncbi:hypothetical protein RchiOBHm_Chr3g0466951 [Rosa chinensis]|uniref:Uncharacterized protein n=1 Tax=Rosa chinensis TaxID=74649 RepID=A0A2P6RA51_ROSCH|nr:hypothetical protein RchiOBHm_Chr3g0466951 [Rosa chinensis]
MNLIGEITHLLPFVQSNLSDCGRGCGVKAFSQGFEPIGASVRNIPGVETEAGNYVRFMSLAHLLHQRPVLLRDPINGEANDAGIDG